MRFILPIMFLLGCSPAQQEKLNSALEQCQVPAIKAASALTVTALEIIQDYCSQAGNQKCVDSVTQAESVAKKADVTLQQICEEVPKYEPFITECKDCVKVVNQVKKFCQ